MGLFAAFLVATTATTLASAFLFPSFFSTQNHRSHNTHSSHPSTFSRYAQQRSELATYRGRNVRANGPAAATSTVLYNAFDGMSLAELEKLEESWTNRYSSEELELGTTCDYVYMRNDGTEIAYTAAFGSSNVTVYYMAAFDSTVNDVKANVIKDDCIRNNRTFVMADWYGCGNSSGYFELGTLTKWTDDTITMLENVVPTEKAVLVGGGIGGWVAFLVARKRPELVSGIVGLAADPDFTEKLLWRYLPEIKKEEIMRQGFSNIVWGGKYQTISRVLIEDAKKNLILDGPLKGMQLHFPVRLIHGLDDEEVPYTVALELSSRIRCSDMQVILINSGGHHLNSNVTDFSVIRRAVDEACTRWKPYVKPKRIKQKSMKVYTSPTTVIEGEEEVEYEDDDEEEAERLRAEEEYRRQQEEDAALEEENELTQGTFMDFVDRVQREERKTAEKTMEDMMVPDFFEDELGMMKNVDELNQLRDF